jgi:glycosyltransferase involved in cell wall biosynthesis
MHDTGPLARARRIYDRSGPRGLVTSVLHRVVPPLVRAALPGAIRSPLAEFVQAHGPARTFVLVSTLDWSFPYRQRPHHLAQALSDAGWPVIFVTPARGTDRILTTRRIGPHLIATPHLDLALTAANRPALYLLSTDTRFDAALITHAIERAGIVIYDYIDALDDAVSNGPVTPERRQLHQRLVSDAQHCVCLVTARQLQEEVTSQRATPPVLVTNGVDVTHFTAIRDRAGLRDDLGRIVDRGKPVVGYFGALAGWLDYDLLRELAERRPDLDLVMIGPDYDGSARALAACPANLHVLPPLDYPQLPAHAAWFDVAMMPFGLNAITEATSPLKMYEYFALGLPVISTPIREAATSTCVLTARTADDWSHAIDEALELRKDAGYRSALQREASANDWQEKAREIITALQRFDGTWRPGL